PPHLSSPSFPTRRSSDLSIALNSQVGGLNPSAVDLALKMGAKVVWFPTISARRHIEHQQAHPDLKFPKPSVPLRKSDIVDILDRSEEHTSELQSRFDLVC